MKKELSTPIAQDVQSVSIKVGRKNFKTYKAGFDLKIKMINDYNDEKFRA